ncbi:hypothetical protein [Maribellus mangrovi]|uniref:hypothetical protein n=1 Tax=Maribellus mangrovi TaxID=3133146 RepID=UPI0030EF5AF6
MYRIPEPFFKLRCFYCFGIIVLFTLLGICATGQEIIVNKLPYDSISAIDESNNQLVDPEIYPEWGNAKNLLYERVAAVIDTSWWIPEIRQAVSEWKRTHEVTDDGKEYYLNTLFQNQKGEFIIERLPYKLQYLFGEIGGGYKVEQVMVLEGAASRNKLIQNSEKQGKTFDPTHLYRPIVCVFDNAISLKETVIKIIDLNAAIRYPNRIQYFSYGKIVPKNISIAFNFGDSKYTFEYISKLCVDQYQYNGYGAIHPVFYNIQLVLSEEKSGQEWIIYKNPDDCNYNISGISVADINGDDYPDILLKVVSELGEWRLVYFSKVGENIKFEYQGFTEIYFIDP